MSFYLVRWEVEIDAETAESAAETAREMQHDPESLATTYEVFNLEEGAGSTAEGDGEIITVRA